MNCKSVDAVIDCAFKSLPKKGKIQIIYPDPDSKEHFYVEYLHRKQEFRTRLRIPGARFKNFGEEINES
jgi:hypothetical protein